MTVRLDRVVPGGFGAAWQAVAGEYLTVVDLEGQQACDFVAFVAADPDEAVSAAHGRAVHRSLFVRADVPLITNRLRPALAFVRDDVGVHDATIPACDPTRYAVEFGVPGHRNCLDNLWEAVRERGIARAGMPEPVNLFQNSPVGDGGRIGLTDPVSRAGERVVFRALLDLFGAVSPCPQDIIPGNGLIPTPIRIVVGSEPFGG